MVKRTARGSPSTHGVLHPQGTGPLVDCLGSEQAEALDSHCHCPAPGQPLFVIGVDPLYPFVALEQRHLALDFAGPRYHFFQKQHVVVTKKKKSSLLFSS